MAILLGSRSRKMAIDYVLVGTFPTDAREDRPDLSYKRHTSGTVALRHRLIPR